MSEDTPARGRAVQRPMHEAAAMGFARSADAYERGRPDYPQTAVEWLTQRLDLHAGCTVIDLAAGTGKLTRLLARTGTAVIGVEPVHAMCEGFVRLLPEVPIVEGTAEAIPLRTGCADAVTVAQAFHWFDGRAALAEVHRVLRPGGVLALLWNRRDLEDPIHRHISRIIDPHRGDTPSHHSGQWRAALRETARFQPSVEVAFDHQQVLDEDGVIDRVTSTSFIAALPPTQLEEVVTALRALVTGAGGRVTLPYRTEVQTFTRTGL